MGFTTKYAWNMSEMVLGGCDDWMDVCAYSPTSLCGGGFVWWGDEGQSLVTMTRSIYDCTTQSLNYVERGLSLNFLLGLIDLIRKYSNMPMRYWNFIWLFRASNMNRWKWSEKSIGDSFKAFRCFNNFLSSTSGSKWWKIDLIRSLNFLNECTKIWGMLKYGNENIPT